MIFLNPPNSRIADIRDFGAVPGQDCSAAFQSAYLWANANSNRFSFPKPVYVPDGDWWVRYPILSRLGSADAWTNPTLSAIGKVSLHDGWRAGMIFWGQSTAGTIIRVPPNSPGFQDAANPIGVFTTGSERGAGGQRDNNPTGGGNIAFRHAFHNMTIVIEAGNPGAIGIDSVVTNRGGASNIRIVDAGGSAKYGISFHRTGSGPAYFKNIVIEGFDCGIWQGALDGTQKSDYLLTFENLTLRNQRTTGIRVNGMPISFRGVVSYNAVPVLVNVSKRSNVTLTNATLLPTDAISKAAMIGQAASVAQPIAAIQSNLGELYLKNITNFGYQTTYEDKSVAPPRTGTGSVAEYFTRLTAFASPTAPKRLDLPVLDAPIFYSLDPNDYANVEDYGASGTTGIDSAPGIQAAIDSGKPIVYFPNGAYNLSFPPIIRGVVRVLMGCTARLQKLSNLNLQDPCLIFRSELAPFVCIENMRIDNITHDCKGTLVVRHCNTEYYRTTENAIGGRTFLEDIMGFVESNYPHDFWCRQLDSEFEPFNLKLVGGSFWCHGYKTEADGKEPLYSTSVHASQGARVQIESAHFYPLNAVPKKTAAIEIDEAKVQVNFRTGTGTFATVIREKRAGVTRTLNTFNTALFRSQL